MVGNAAFIVSVQRFPNYKHVTKKKAKTLPYTLKKLEEKTLSKIQLKCAKL